MNPTNEVLRPKEAADFLKVSPDTLAVWRVNGNGPPYIKIGRRIVLYRLEDLRAWVEAIPARTNTSNVA